MQHNAKVVVIKDAKQNQKDLKQSFRFHFAKQSVSWKMQEIAVEFGFCCRVNLPKTGEEN